ncbi:hypothetical protein SAMN04489802_1860 [Pseudomonas chlororaphis]|uniref:hypothetical protein n=1 Tax=Pseudomonas chlororaphis TaxID=587753 RepID=UPI00087A2A0B|nr:hypothetical protein [Pseudomonas chlororaphis]AZD68540.1 Chromosome segregation ATPase [Pseudomonas chlororaphis subsp. aurantiaca]QIT24419.1 hypothetical protein HCN09_22820 [Pseudomonas chlororaphis subsp. aurantiaca]WDH02534.1 hypothetical protein PUP57_23970 [Pseudomonas chlororaphis]WDH08618.1 hypothetical protein PUP64_23040 [Pseudomonas chlororaphis]SDS62313.1 hypothetical protein SAMN04489802_1860 [Pseudomonas chlororaphis]
MLLRTISIKNAEQEVLNGAVLCSFAIPMLSRNFLAYSLNEGAEVGESRVYLAMLNKAGQSYSLSSIEAEEDWRQVIQVFKEIVTHASLPEGRQQGAGGSTDIPYHLIDLKDCVIPTGKLSDHRSLTIKKNLVLKLISSEVSVACLPAIDSVELGVPMLDASISMSSQKIPAAQAAAECLDEVSDSNGYRSPGTVEGPEGDAFDDVSSGFAPIGDPEELSQKPGEAETEVGEVLADTSLFTESFQHDMTVMPTANAEKYVNSSESDAPLSGHLTPEVVAGHSANSEADIGRLSQGIQSTLAGLAEVVRDLASEEEMKLIQSDEYDLSISDSVPTLMDRQVQATADIEQSAQVAGDVTPDEVADYPIPLESSLDETQFLMATLPEAEAALQGADTDHLLLDVESTLSNLALMAQELTQQKLVAVKQQEALELLKEQLQERERKLHDKDEHLRQLQSQLQQEKIAIDKSAEHNSRVIAERSAALQQLAESVESRERSVARRSELMQLEQQRLDEISAKQSIRAAELEKRDVGIQQKNAELVEKLTQLSSTRKKLSNIVKGFNETVTFNNSLHSISSTLLSDDE